MAFMGADWDPQDHAVAGEPGPFLAEDGEVREVLLVIIVPHHGDLLDGVKRELGLGTFSGPGARALHVESHLNLESEDVVVLSGPFLKSS